MRGVVLYRMVQESLATRHVATERPYTRQYTRIFLVYQSFGDESVLKYVTVGTDIFWTLQISGKYEENFSNIELICVISCFCREVDETWALPGCYAASSLISLPLNAAWCPRRAQISSTNVLWLGSNIQFLTKLNVAQSKHNNIFNNVKFATCFGYSNHHQADISVRGHDMFSATVWNPYCLHLLCRIS